jgi:hypothetical protein
MSSKPKKYGIKKFWLCESGTGYALNGIIYCGRRGNQPEKDLAHNVVMKLSEPFRNSGRNITTDNFFTSHTSARDLLEQNLTLLGTMRHNRKEIPQCMRKARKQELQSSEFRFDNKNKISLCSYVPKKNKAVILLSSSHFAPQVVGPERKPSMIYDYNNTMGAVEQLNENVEEFTVRRKTTRWPVLIFFNIIDVASYNSYVISTQNGNPASRKNFLKNLAVKLALRYMTQRLQQCKLRPSTSRCIRLFVLNQGKPMMFSLV